MFVGNQLLIATERKQVINTCNKLISSTTRNRRATKLNTNVGELLFKQQTRHWNEAAIPRTFQVNFTGSLTDAFATEKKNHFCLCLKTSLGAKPFLQCIWFKFNFMQIKFIFIRKALLEESFSERSKSQLGNGFRSRTKPCCHDQPKVITHEALFADKGLWMRHDKALGQVNGMYLKYVPGVILDKETIGSVSTQKTGHYCSTAGDGMSGLKTASRR